MRHRIAALCILLAGPIFSDTNNVKLTCWIVDPSYRFSKRRLNVMRSAQNRCWNAMLTNYVTNAINELVAYPEANLPD